MYVPVKCVVYEGRFQWLSSCGGSLGQDTCGCLPDVCSVLQTRPSSQSPYGSRAFALLSGNLSESISDVSFLILLSRIHSVSTECTRSHSHEYLCIIGKSHSDLPVASAHCKTRIVEDQLQPQLPTGLHASISNPSKDSIKLGLQFH